MESTHISWQRGVIDVLLHSFAIHRDPQINVRRRYRRSIHEKATPLLQPASRSPRRSVDHEDGTVAGGGGRTDGRAAGDETDDVRPGTVRTWVGRSYRVAVGYAGRED